MVFHPSHRPLEIATRFPQFHSPDDDDISPTNKKHKGTLLSSYRGGHFYWALTQGETPMELPDRICTLSRGRGKPRWSVRESRLPRSRDPADLARIFNLMFDIPTFQRP